MNKFNKLFLKPISLALLVSCLVCSNAWAIEANVAGLAAQLAPILKIIRALAFLGCVVILIEEAWTAIKSGFGEKAFSWEAEGKKLIAMAVGFIILFSVGAIITAFLPAAGDVVAPFN